MRLPIAKRYMLLIEIVLICILLALLIAPLSLPAGSIGGLDGSIGTLDHGDDLNDVPWPQRAVYLLGDVNCHQQADRSFFVNENQMPFCARDLGLLAGATLGLAAFVILERRVTWAWLLLLTGALAGFAAGYGAGTLIADFFAAPEDGNWHSQQ